jgi:uncharacterized protein YdhG (YjbR/CyaY superfamily)
MDAIEKIQTVNEYIAQFPPEVRKKLNELRAAVLEAAPDAAEKISWGMPSYSLHGMLVYFAAFKNHIGFYPGASGVGTFLPGLSGYKTSKGTIQFPLDRPMPLDLVREIVRFRVGENIKKAESKKKK